MPAWRSGIVALLFPALFLLPTFHLHPGDEHTHGIDGTHRHGPVVHTDFLPFSAHNHGEHGKGHRVPDDSSPQPPSQISFPTLLPRGPIVSPPALEKVKVSVSLPVAGSANSSLFSFFARGLTRDHAPPVQDFVFSPAPPRSPPRFL
jgi:hypothetical protein